MRRTADGYGIITPRYRVHDRHRLGKPERHPDFSIRRDADVIRAAGQRIVALQFQCLRVEQG